MSEEINSPKYAQTKQERHLKFPEGARVLTVLKQLELFVVTNPIPSTRFPGRTEEGLSNWASAGGHGNLHKRFFVG